MTLGYFRLILRCFGDTPDRRAAILEGTGVTEEMVRDRLADISLFQQVRQIENAIGLFGEGWALRAPELWNPSSHGPLGVAALAAPDMAAMIEVITRFSFVRAPFYEMSLRRGRTWRQIDFELTVPIDERLWRPMVEIAFVGVRTLMASMLASPPREAKFFFGCAEPAHAAEVRATLGDVVYGAPRNAIRFPSAWLALESPFADAALYGVALSELQAAAGRVTAPVGLRGRVERLLASLPAGRLTSDEIARLMGVSRRTLVRRLGAAGVSYRKLADAELRNRALRLLQAGGLTHARVAEELGYADPTGLSRACRRWFRNGALRQG
ncbi:MAG TPA: AraC family transcriptional regulator ligand-binding domain-containing protein [Caulobacteraceae bacterium]